MQAPRSPEGPEQSLSISMTEALTFRERQDGAVESRGSLNWETNRVFLTNGHINSINLLATIDRLLIVAEFE